jgi:hypothetical protein
MAALRKKPAGSRALVLEEVAQELDGEDPLLLPVREVLDKTHRELIALHSLLDFVDVEAELPEPDEERVAALREHWLHACGS